MKEEEAEEATDKDGGEDGGEGSEGEDGDGQARLLRDVVFGAALTRRAGDGGGRLASAAPVYSPQTARRPGSPGRACATRVCVAALSGADAHGTGWDAPQVPPRLQDWGPAASGNEGRAAAGRCETLAEPGAARRQGCAQRRLGRGEWTGALSHAAAQTVDEDETLLAFVFALRKQSTAAKKPGGVRGGSK